MSDLEHMRVAQSVGHGLSINLFRSQFLMELHCQGVLVCLVDDEKINTNQYRIRQAASGTQHLSVT